MMQVDPPTTIELAVEWMRKGGRALTAGRGRATSVLYP